MSKISTGGPICTESRVVFGDLDSQALCAYVMAYSAAIEEHNVAPE